MASMFSRTRLHKSSDLMSKNKKAVTLDSGRVAPASEGKGKAKSKVKQGRWLERGLSR